MSSVNIMAREISAKIVFYGPGLSGKTTTLKKIYESVKPAHRGEMMSLPTEADRTLFFDFLPVKVERVGECSVRLALYTVPGQVFYNATRKLVLQGADGVVFVADSQPEALDSTLESLKNLEENLLEQGLRIDKIPLVVQYNKRDIPKSLPVEELRAALNPRGVPDFETCATSGRGVLDTLKSITRLVIRDLQAKRVVPAARKPPPKPVELEVQPGPHQAGLEDQIQQHLAQSPDSELVDRAKPASPVAAVAVATAAAKMVAPSVAPAIAPVIALASASPERSAPADAVERAASARASGSGMGPAAALAPSALFDHCRAVDTSFAEGRYDDCVRSSHETVRRVLAYAGEGSLAQQGFLLGVDGGDLLRLELMSNKSALRVDDAAFAVYVVLQTLSRLARAGLPHHD